MAKVTGEEKCCSHGCAPLISCVVCGKVRGSGDPPWSCLGSVTQIPNPDAPDETEPMYEDDK